MKKKVIKSNWHDYLSGSLRAFKIKDFKLAEEYLEKAFSTAEMPEPYFYLLAGHINFSREKYEEAEKNWKKVLETDPGNAEAWNNLGVLYKRTGENEKALAAFQEAASIDPERADILFNLGNINKILGNTEKAVENYKKAIHINPGYIPAYNNLGTLLESTGKEKEAQEIFRQGLSSDKNSASLRYNLGLIYQKENKLDNALESFKSALKSKPGWTPCLNNLGIIQQELGKTEEAAETFKALLEIEPENVSALNNLGIVFSHLGKKEESKNLFKKALKKKPEYINAALNLHELYESSNELNEALEELNQQLNHHPSDPRIKLKIAKTLLKLNRFDEAEQSIENVLQRFPDNKEALKIKAELFLKTSRPEMAEKMLKDVSGDSEILKELAKVYLDSGNTGKAKNILRKITDLFPDDTESKRLYSSILGEENPQEAIKITEEILKKEGTNTQDLLSLADLYGKTGNKNQAIEKLDELISYLSSKGGAEDLDKLNSVLESYEETAKALEEEKNELFSNQINQLQKTINALFSGPEKSDGKSADLQEIISFEEIPVDMDDAVSLLDINSMEPVIQINEEEETILLEEKAEDFLDDEYLEIQEEDVFEYTPAPETGVNSSGKTSTPDRSSSQGPVPASAQSPPINIQLTTPPAPAAPQVIYQEIKPVEKVPDNIKESAEESLLYDFEENTEEEDSFYVPESDALAEEIEDNNEEGHLAPEADIIFDEKTAEQENPIEDLINENTEDTEEPENLELSEDDLFTEETDLPDESEELELLEEELLESDDFSDENTEPPEEELELSEDDLFTEETDLPDENKELELSENDLTEPDEEETEKIDREKLAKMFSYLTELTEEATGEERQVLIENSIPLKLAGLSAKLSGEPGFLETAQKYDRRKRERHNIIINEEKIRESLNVLKSLAEEYPMKTVKENLNLKLEKVISHVKKS